MSPVGSASSWGRDTSGAACGASRDAGGPPPLGTRADGRGCCALARPIRHRSLRPPHRPAPCNLTMPNRTARPACPGAWFVLAVADRVLQGPMSGRRGGLVRGNRRARSPGAMAVCAPARSDQQGLGVSNDRTFALAIHSEGIAGVCCAACEASCWLGVARQSCLSRPILMPPRSRGEGVFWCGCQE